MGDGTDAKRWHNPTNLPGFGVYDNIRVTFIGDDGEHILALGHHEPHHVIAAFDQAARDAGYHGMCDGDTDAKAEVPEQLQRLFANVYWETPDAQPQDWVLRWADKPHDHYSFPITVWEATW